MKNIWRFFLFIVLISLLGCAQEKSLSVAEYRSKMKAGWIGQMAGVGWGAPTEFRWNGRIIPRESVPEWTPEMINQFYQDDLYVEMTFLKTLEEHGLGISNRRAGIDFANSQYRLWHANKFARDNMRAGIAPPWSGHPKFNEHTDDIDYQIEADYAGLISPGMPQSCIDLGETFGRLMNYGDGLYGGQFISAMYAEAFFETDMKKIIHAGLTAIPEQSQYYEAITDVINWHSNYPDDWTQTWQLIYDKYEKNLAYRKFSCSNEPDPNFNIDAKLNGAFVVMGLLYGNGDIDQTIIISMRCGQDSDCNPSNAAGILATSLGIENIPDKFKSALKEDIKFSYTDYNFPQLLNVCEKLTRQNVIHYGGKIDSVFGQETFHIPVSVPVTSRFEQSWTADTTIPGQYFTATEMAKIIVKNRKPEDLIRLWHVSGPYLQKGKNAKALFDIQFPPEQNEGKWKKIQLGKKGHDNRNINFDYLYKGENRVAYAKTLFYADAFTKAIIELGSDDGVKVWHNGQLVHENNVLRACNLLDDKIHIEIKKGWNELLFKVTQGSGGWELTACITDEEGNALRQLKYSH